MWIPTQFTKPAHSVRATWQVLPEKQKGSHFHSPLFLGGNLSCSTFSFSPQIIFLYYVKSLGLPSIQECRCPTKAQGKGVFKHAPFSRTALPSSTFGQERRKGEVVGIGKGKGTGEDPLGSLVYP